MSPLFSLIFLRYFLCLFEHVPQPQTGEEYYSMWLRNHFTQLVKIIFVLIGGTAGFYFTFNPWTAAICLHLIFPLAAIAESAVYPTSHNLIPIELAYDLWLALPTIVAIYVGRFVSRQAEKQKQKRDEKFQRNVP